MVPPGKIRSLMQKRTHECVVLRGVFSEEKQVKRGSTTLKTLWERQERASPLSMALSPRVPPTRQDKGSCQKAEHSSTGQGPGDLPLVCKKSEIVGCLSDTRRSTRKTFLPTKKFEGNHAREILPVGKILACFLLAHFFVSSQIYVGMAPVVEATHRLALLATWGKISYESRVGGGWWLSHREEASSTKTLSHWLEEERVVR